MIIINEKICDNAKECGGIAVCPTSAIFWDETIGKLAVNNDLCVSCQKCVIDGCPIGAISIVDNITDYENERARIEADERKAEDLFVERYGASVIENDILINISQISEVTKSGEYTFIEKFNDDSIQCLLHSIPISEIKSTLNIKFNYYKCDVGVVEAPTTYPILEIYYGTTCLGQIEGYYTTENQKELLDKIMIIINEK